MISVMITNLLALLLQGTSFDAAAGAFSGCLVDTVKMGMMTKAAPDAFATGFAKSCKPEEARFRAEAITEAIKQGRTKAEAEADAEVDANIANARRIFAADQARFVATGQVPR